MTAFPKPRRGSHRLEREARRAALVEAENVVKAQAKARDGHRCRWPERHQCRGGLEACHLRAKGMGSDGGTRTYTGNLITLCAWMHRSGPETVEHHEVRIEAETPLGADGPLSFWRESADGHWYCVGRERSVGVLERD